MLRAMPNAGQDFEALLNEAVAQTAAGQGDHARVARRKALEALDRALTGGEAGQRQRLARCFLDGGEPEQALAALGPALRQPATPAPLARQALYDAAAHLRGGVAPIDPGSEAAKRALRLAGFHPNEIRLVQGEIAKLLDPYAAEHGGEVDRRRPAIDPHNAYAICMTPRSGSNFLVRCLTETALLGRPGEYLHRNEPSAMPSIVARFGTPTLDAVMAEVMHRTRSPNGVFGIKLHIGMLLPLLVEGTFERAFAGAKFLYTTREDLLAQAISFARASITGAWLSKNEAAPAEFSFEAIHGAVRHISHMMGQWETFFALHGIRPLRITYEEIDRDVDGVIARVSEHLGVALPEPTRFNKARDTVQRDAINDAWRKRFLEMMQPGVN
jgi:trehalose 2-sulfotransferase